MSHEKIDVSGNGHGKTASGLVVARTLPESVLQQRASYDIGEIADHIDQGLERVKKSIVGRDAVVNQTLYALLTREHQLIYSKPGVAKTQFAQTLFDQFDAPTFEIHATKGTPEEAFVGPIDIGRLKQLNSELVHNTEGTLVTAKLAHLDELFDANDAALRAIMGILLERKFNKGKQQETANLHTAIASTNYLRNTDITAAVLDRFAFKAYMMPQVDYYTQLRIDHSYEETMKAEPSPKAKIPFDYVEYLADIVEGKVPGHEIKVPYHVLFLKNAIINDFVASMQSHRQDEKQGEFYISPRTIAKTRKVLNASALLHGRREATVDDLDALVYMLCEVGDTTQQRVFEQIKTNDLRKIKKKDLEIVDILMATSEVLEDMFGSVDFNSRVSVIERVKALFHMEASELTFPRILQYIEAIKPSHEKVQDLKNGLLARIRHEQAIYEAGGKGSSAILL